MRFEHVRGPGIALLVAGCGGSTTIPPGGADAQSPLDAGDATADGPAITDGGHGDGSLGAPCTSDEQCSGALCLGGAFAGGYCTSPVAECDPGSSASGCGDAGECKKTGAMDVDGSPTGEYCLVTCSAPGDCRSGYSCCPAQEYPLADAAVCAPASLCRDQ